MSIEKKSIEYNIKLTMYIIEQLEQNSTNTEICLKNLSPGE